MRWILLWIALLILNLPPSCPNKEPLPSLASSPMPPSVVSSPKLELKPSLDKLKYVSLGSKETRHIIISSFLSNDQEKELIRVFVFNVRMLFGGQLLI